MLLPDPQRALVVVQGAERSRDALRRARTDAARHGAELDDAAEELVAQGLTVPAPRSPEDQCASGCSSASASFARFQLALTSRSASARPTQVAPSTLLPGSSSL